MNYYGITFKGSPNREYFYKSKLDLPVGAECKIVADNTTFYRTSVMIAKKFSAQEGHYMIANLKRDGIEARTITSFDVVKGAPRPSDRIQNVYFNEEKGTTCVLWDDGKKTLIHCAPEDTWDKEKALALCYMKRVLGNKGSFNETLKKYCWEEEK